MARQDNAEEFMYIKEDDYKTLISVYQQKTFDLFNQNIALEAKISTLNSLIKNMNETIEQITKERDKASEKASKKTSNRRSKSTPILDETAEIVTEEETF
jgi:predicted RNase H-like nuclease (RuvC/YqgF family)